MVQGDEREVRRNRGYQRLSQEREIGERVAYLEAPPFWGRVEGCCLAQEEANRTVFVEFWRFGSGRDSLRAVPSVSCRLGH